MARGALTFGSMAHNALEAWYPPGNKRGVHPAETFAKLYHEQQSDYDQWDEEGNSVNALDLGVGMMNHYVEHWGEDSHLEIIQPEMTFAIDVYDKAGRYLCTFVGTIDGPARNKQTGRVVLLEHKTAKSLQEIHINSQYGEQGLGYWWAATMWLRHLGELGPDELIDGVMFNVLRKALKDERPVNAQGHHLNKPKKDALVAAVLAANPSAAPAKVKKAKVDDLMEWLEDHGIDPAQFGEPSKNQPPPYFDRQELILGTAELQNYATRLRSEAYEMALVRKGKLPIYKNPSADCSWKCAFKDVCEVHEMGGDWEGMLEFDFKPWDPYADHERNLED